MSKDQIIDDQSSSSVVSCNVAQQPKQRQRHLVTFAGFTMIELLVVVAILGTLAILSIPTYNEFVSRAKNGRAKQEVRVLEREIIGYFMETESLPITLGEISRGDLKDPWGNPYVYFNTPTRSKFGIMLNTDFDIFSKGEDGNTDPVVSSAAGKDDLVRGADGAFLGFGEDW
jgi:general secretion pathway protein G